MNSVSFSLNGNISSVSPIPFLTRRKPKFATHKTENGRNSSQRARTWMVLLNSKNSDQVFTLENESKQFLKSKNVFHHRHSRCIMEVRGNCQRSRPYIPFTPNVDIAHKRSLHNEFFVSKLGLVPKHPKICFLVEFHNLSVGHFFPRFTLVQHENFIFTEFTCRSKNVFHVLFVILL